MLRIFTVTSFLSLWYSFFSPWSYRKPLNRHFHVINLHKKIFVSTSSFNLQQFLSLFDYCITFAEMNLPPPRWFYQIPYSTTFLAVHLFTYPSIIYSSFLTADGKKHMHHFRWSFSFALLQTVFSFQTDFLRAASCKVTCVLTIFSLHQISQHAILI